jgi:hypothetical protein
LDINPCFVRDDLHQLDFFHVVTELRPSANGGFYPE